MIDSDAIINLTRSVFEKSGALKGRTFETITQTSYSKLHSTPLVPLNLKIDVEKFLIEINQFSQYFEKWGTDFDLPRYGLALVNKCGNLHTPDVVNQSLMEWNKNHPDKPCLELDFTKPTPVLDLPSLAPLNVFTGHWCRSNIFKLEKDSEFKPHIDTLLPSMWFRLWGTTNTENTVVRFYDNHTKEMIAASNIEPGRIYLIDTSIVHDAYASDTVYQFFLSVKPSAESIIESLL